MTEEEIQEIIGSEIVVDANDDDEVFMGWYYFMAESLAETLKAITVWKYWKEKAYY